jgi:hypothetical protein
MGGEQAATVLAVVESDKRQREGQAWGEGEQEEFKRKIRERCGGWVGGWVHAAQVGGWVQQLGGWVGGWVRA